MNPINELFNKLTDEELLVIMGEIEHCEQLGSYPIEAEIRVLCRKVTEITGNDVSSNLLVVQMNVFRECAFRWKIIIEK